MRCNNPYLTLTGSLLGLLVGLLFTNTALAKEFDHSHKQWDILLQQYVVEQGPESKVRYAKIKANPKAFEGYLNSLSSVTQAQLDAWSTDQQLAFFINAYNAFTIKLIVDHYPVDSIKNIGNWFKNAWKIEFFKLLGKSISLDAIEHDWIRGNNRYHEPRIHFALVCASIGCPKLQPHAYTAEQLNTMLEIAANEFLNDKTRNYFSSKDNTLYLSSIFKWYGSDFEIENENTAKFVATRINPKEKNEKQINPGMVNIKYLDYDWALNDAKQ